MEKKLSSRSGSIDDGIPDAKYTRIGEKIRQVVPGPMQCSVGCGGRNCKWENPARWSDADQAIKGVFSTWVLDDVVAMSRPSTEVIRKYKMIEQFKRHNIRSIINLQRPGEHASCGPPLDRESLFTYRPQDFMDNDVFFYNFGWKDYGVTSMTTILDMVKVMSFAIEEGKVAVHCHAGLGRTGVLIACYLVYAERMDPTAAIITVRKKRSSSIQTRGQIACISEFWQFLRPLRIVFPQVVPHARRLTLKQFLNRQRLLLHGFESRELRHVPKLVHVVCKRLSEIAQSRDSGGIANMLPQVILKRSNTVSDIKQTLPGAFVNEKRETSSDMRDPDVSKSALNGQSSTADAVSLPQHASGLATRPSDDQTEPRSRKSSPPLSVKGVLPTEVEEENGNSSNDEKTLSDKYRSVTDQDSVFTVESGSIRKNSLPSPSVEFDSHANGLEDLTNIPDDQIEKEVNEILGNANNNHSIKNTSVAIYSVAGKTPSGKPPSALVTTNSDSATESRSVTESNLTITEKRSESESSRLSSQQATVPLRKLMASGGKSDTVLPTGSPIKNPRSSAKARQLSVTPADGVMIETDQLSYDNSESIDNKEGRPTISRPSAPVVLPDPDSSSVFVDSDRPSCPPTKTNPPNLKNKPIFTIPNLEFTSPNFSTDGVSSDDDDVTSIEITTTDVSIVEATLGADSSDSLDQSSDTATVAETRCGERSEPNQVGSSPAESADGATPTLSIEKNVSSPGSIEKPIREDEIEAAAEIIKSDMVKLRDASDDGSDDNLDEIIDIPNNDDNDGKSLDGDDVEANLSLSMASRVSWSLMQGAAVPVPAEERQFSAASNSSRSGRKTPLMYRGERNLALMVDDSVVTEDGLLPSKEADQSRTDFSDDDDTPVAPGNDLDAESSSGDDANASEAERLGCELNKQLALPRISATRSLSDLSSHVSEAQVSLSRCSSSGDMRHPSPHGHQSPPEHVIPFNVALALSYKLVDDEWLWEKVYSLQIEINNHKDAWRTVSEATDPYLLSALMWTWIEHLSEPVLSPKNASQLLAIMERVPPHEKTTRAADIFEKALNSLEPSISNTIKCLLFCVTSFPAIPKRVADSMVERVVCAITRTPMPPAAKKKINVDLERLFEQYINAKYDVSKRKRFIDESSDVVVEETKVGASSDVDDGGSAVNSKSLIDDRNSDLRTIIGSSTGSVVATDRRNSLEARPGIVVN